MKYALAEIEGFEPPARFRVTSFQDWLFKPLRHISIQGTLAPIDNLGFYFKCDDYFPAGIKDAESELIYRSDYANADEEPIVNKSASESVVAP